MRAVAPHFDDATAHLGPHLSVTRRLVCAWASVPPVEWPVPIVSWPHHEVDRQSDHSAWPEVLEHSLIQVRPDAPVVATPAPVASPVTRSARIESARVEGLARATASRAGPEAQSAKAPTGRRGRMKAAAPLQALDKVLDKLTLRGRRN